jgi:hypothetical protein
MAARDRKAFNRKVFGALPGQFASATDLSFRKAAADSTFQFVTELILVSLPVTSSMKLFAQLIYLIVFRRKLFR